MKQKIYENLLEKPQHQYGDGGEHAARKYRRRFVRWYRVYLCTTLLVVAITVALLISVLYADSFSPLKLINLESIASNILQNSFMKFPIPIHPPQETPGGDGIFPQAPTPQLPQGSTESSATLPPTLSPESIYDFDYSKVPVGHTPIVPMDLSLTSYGNSYIFNSTGYKPNIEKLLSSSLSWNSGAEFISLDSAPLVLIVHTHGTEAYSENGAISFLDDGSEIGRSEDTSKNIVAVGAHLSERLNAAGISTLHCTIMHDKLQYKDSYLRAEETIRQYLEKYPSIRLVIDLHRDAILKSSGELVRPVTLVNSRPAAQLMCVVGSDWSGEACNNWEGNLSLALKLRESLNQKYQNLCRPTYLRPSTYNQELSRYSLLLEVGSSGNSLEEALHSVELVSAALAELLNS